MPEPERATEKETLEEKKTTITIAEKPTGDEPKDERPTTTVAEESGE